MFKNCTVSTISDSQFANRDIYNNTHIHGAKTGLEVLYEKAAPGGCHISDERYDPPKCHENTRIAIRQDLLNQVTIALVSCMIWVYGAAGAGKSAIAQSFAEMCEEQGLLIGTFFFFRASPLRNNARRLAASLAYQLARTIPSTLPYIAHCIETHPAIFSSSLRDQIDKLFVQPLRSACGDDPTLDPRPRLIILDGLDECDTPNAQRNIINILETALQAAPIPIVVLVASRPEIHISSTFESLDRHASIPIFFFDLNAKYVDGDIRLYLNDKFKEIRRDHPFRKYLPDNWPRSKDVESIVQKSSGQFIYAATIIRYIGHHQCKPHEWLQAALDASKYFTSTVRNSPFKELDVLYLQIFSGLEDTLITLTILHLALTKDVSGCSARTPRSIAIRLGLGLGDVELHICNLASLMKFEGEQSPIRFFHASLHDFLVDKQRSLHLHINQPAVHTALSKAYLRKILTSVPASVVLHSCQHHLRLAELDQELSDLAARVESRLPGCIKAFQFDLVALGWGVLESTSSSYSNYFSYFIDCVYKLKDNLVRHTNDHTFWDRCVDAIHEVLQTQLSVYLTDENTHDFLALTILTRNTWKSPGPHIASSIGLSASASVMCCHIDIFNSWLGHIPCDGVAQQIMVKFVLDSNMSKKLHVTPEQCARVATKCLGMIENTRLTSWLNVKDALSSDEEVTYLWAVRGISSVLWRASRCQRLIMALEEFNRQPRWLAHYPFHARDGQEAIDSYLKAHSSMDGTSQCRVS